MVTNSTMLFSCFLGPFLSVQCWGESIWLSVWLYVAGCGHAYSYAQEWREMGESMQIDVKIHNAWFLKKSQGFQWGDLGSGEHAQNRKRKRECIKFLDIPCQWSFECKLKEIVANWTLKKELSIEWIMIQFNKYSETRKFEFGLKVLLYSAATYKTKLKCMLRTLSLKYSAFVELHLIICSTNSSLKAFHWTDLDAVQIEDGYNYCCVEVNKAENSAKVHQCPGNWE